jgi:hypothetical protein
MIPDNQGSKWIALSIVIFLSYGREVFDRRCKPAVSRGRNHNQWPSDDGDHQAA